MIQLPRLRGAGEGGRRADATGAERRRLVVLAPAPPTQKPPPRSIGAAAGFTPAVFFRFSSVYFPALKRFSISFQFTTLHHAEI